MPLRSVGFPCARHEAAEVREFLPAFFAFLRQLQLERVVVEQGYGARLQVAPAEYDAAFPGLERGSRDSAFAQELVVTLRCPPEADLYRLRRGAVLACMMHFSAWPGRAALLEERGVTGVALEEIVDELDRHLIDHTEAVAFNGIRVGMETLAAAWPSFASPQRAPLRVTVLGGGKVGAHAVRAAVRYGDERLRERLQQARVRGVMVTVLDRELTADTYFLEKVLSTTDLLVDATRRANTTVPVLQNAQLGILPAHAVIVDLSGDAEHERAPPVGAIEGLPRGNLDHYVFPVTDPAWEGVDPRIPNPVRRPVASCASWPGLRPLECMRVHGAQLEPIVRALLSRGVAPPTADSTVTERAIARAFHQRWLVSDGG